MVSDNCTDLIGVISGSLNPYSDGRWFLIMKMKMTIVFLGCLNPYSDGRWFLIGGGQRARGKND